MMTIFKKKRVLTLAGIGLAFLLVFIVLHLDRINLWLDYVTFVLRPLIIGLVLAYLANPIFRLFERKLLSRVPSHSLRRSLSLLCTYIVLLLVVVTLALLILPQLWYSIRNFLENWRIYVNDTVGDINPLIEHINASAALEIPLIGAEEIKHAVDDFFSEQLALIDIWEQVKDLNYITIIQRAVVVIKDLFFIVADIVFGIFISLYILHSKEKLYAHVMRLRQALFSDKTNRRITSICTVADRSFGGFLRGKILDSTIVGIMIYGLLYLMGIEYALLIATIVAITDIVPIIGPFVGVIPSAIIILLTDPIKVIPFLLCILLVQQIDGNIIAPKILGENTGVSSLCVVIAITVMGAVWGFVGMIVAVPLFATILELTSRFLDGQLKKKKLASDADEDAVPKEPQVKTLLGLLRRRKRKSHHIGGKGTLLPEERERLRAYTLATKYHVLSDPGSDDAFDAFAKEYNQKTNADTTSNAVEHT